MSDQTQASLAQKTIDADKLLVCREDREILRRLAGRVAELAACPNFPHISVDYEATDKLLSLAKKVLGDLLAVRLKGR